MHIISLYRSITNQTNLISKKHFERDIISFFKQHVARLPLPPLKVKVQVYEYHRKIAPTMREKLCKPTLTMHILTYNIYQNAQDSPITCSLEQKSTVSPVMLFNNYFRSISFLIVNLGEIIAI